MFFMTENLIKNANGITCFRAAVFSCFFAALGDETLLETLNFDLFAAAAVGHRDASADLT